MEVDILWLKWPSLDPISPVLITCSLPYSESNDSSRLFHPRRQRQRQRQWIALMIQNLLNNDKISELQESIPVGCVLPAFMTTTRCQYQWGRYLCRPLEYIYPSAWIYLPPVYLASGYTYPYPIQERTWDQRYLWKHYFLATPLTDVKNCHRYYCSMSTNLSKWKTG